MISANYYQTPAILSVRLLVFLSVESFVKFPCYFYLQKTLDFLILFAIYHTLKKWNFP